MNTRINESLPMGFKVEKTEFLDSPIAVEEPAPQSKTLPYMPFERPLLPAPAVAVTPMLRPHTEVRQPRPRTGPPLGVASMLVAATVMLVASGGMAITALLELV